MKLYGVEISGPRVELKVIEVVRETKACYYVNASAVTGWANRIAKASVSPGRNVLALTPDEAWDRAIERVTGQLERAEHTVEACRAQHARVLECRQDA